MRLGLTTEQEQEFLVEAEAKIGSLEEEIDWIEDHLALKKNALAYWTKRRNRMRRLLSARKKRK